MGADDQQERPSARARREGEALDANAIPVETGWYLTGFADGEGSFNVSFRPRTDYSFPWKISLCFNISQRDPTVLRLSGNPGYRNAETAERRSVLLRGE